MPPIKFLLKIIYGFEEVVWKFQEGCLVQDYLLYLSGMKEAFLSLFLAWPIQSSFCSWGSMVWRKMLFEEYQDCCLVLGHPDIWMKCFNLFWASMLPGFYSRGHMVLKKKLFEEFKDGCLMHGHVCYLNGIIWANQGLRFALVSAQEDFWFGRCCLNKI